jgi:hypothetical protein
VQGPKRPGERIYKGHKSYDLMLNLQLGIRFCVGGSEARQDTPTLKTKDFQLTVLFSCAEPLSSYSACRVALAPCVCKALGLISRFLTHT